MRVGIDCRLAGKNHAGIGRYTQELVTRLVKQHPDHSWVLFFSSKDQAQEVLGDVFDSVEIVYISSRHYTISEQVEVWLAVKKANLDLLHVPHFNIPLLTFVPLVVTIHDLLWHEQRGGAVTTLSGWKYWIKYLGYRVVTQVAVWKAQTIIVPAETIKETIESYYPGTSKKIVVTYEGASDSFLLSKKILKKPEKNLVFVGSLYPHKNVALVVQALIDLPGYSLSIIGSRSVFRERLEKLVTALALQKRVHFLGFQADQEVARVLSTAHALVQPSISEGFGLTGIEAMAAECPVIASRIPIFSEIYKNAAVLFNPHEVSDFVLAVKKLEQNEVRKIHIQRGLELSGRYSWDTMATKTFAVYKSVLSNT